MEHFDEGPRYHPSLAHHCYALVLGRSHECERGVQARENGSKQRKCVRHVKMSARRR